jgi:hypothetical protein
MSGYDIGDQVRLTAQFRDGSGNPADPAGVLLTIRDPNGVTTVYTYGVDAIAKDDVGAYHYDLTVTSAGTWIYRWEGTANPQTAEEGQLVVRPSQIATGPPPTIPAVDPCALLAQAQLSMFQLCNGSAVVVIETPQLGRVEYARTSATAVADLQRLIDQLTAQCLAKQGLVGGRRKPISIEAWP